MCVHCVCVMCALCVSALCCFSRSAEVVYDVVDELSRRLPTEWVTVGFHCVVVFVVFLTWVVTTGWDRFVSDAWVGWKDSPLAMRLLPALAATIIVESLRRLFVFVSAICLGRCSVPCMLLFRKTVGISIFLLVLLALFYQVVSLPGDPIDTVIFYGLLPLVLIIWHHLSESPFEEMRRQRLATRSALGEGMAWNLYANFLRPMADKIDAGEYQVHNNAPLLQDSEKIIYVLIPILHREPDQHIRPEELGPPIGRITIEKDHAGQASRPYVLSSFARPNAIHQRLIVTYAASLETLSAMQALFGVPASNEERMRRQQIIGSDQFKEQDAQREARRMAARLKILCDYDADTKNGRARIKVCDFSGHRGSLRPALEKLLSPLQANP